jgi:hypothetical protein
MSIIPGIGSSDKIFCSWRSSGSVLMLKSYLCVKYSSRLDLVEAQNMLFTANDTSVPVPKLYFAFPYEEYTYVLMERIYGQMAARS